jgi:tetratricopeptide (TPR) repeat protein
MFVAAILIQVLAQVNATTPPSQGSLPTATDRVYQELHLDVPGRQGDEHYLRRAEGRSGDVAEASEISAALDAYEAGFRRSREDVDDRWKYLRATYFKAEFTGMPEEQQTALYERAIPVGVEATDLLRKRAAAKAGRKASTLEPDEIGRALAGDGSAAEAFFWLAVVRGQWALHHGKLAAARQGVAGRVRDETRIVIAIDPKAEDAGGYRVLGRLHSVAPKVPFFTGWVDRDESIRLLRKAVDLAPENLLNMRFLAEALDEHANRRAEAREILEKVIAAPPHPDSIVEDLHAQEAARKTLASWATN